MTEFGSGIFLTQDLDFEVTNSGDIRTIGGVPELEKDLSYNLLIESQEILGQPTSPETSADLERIIEQTVSDDPRVGVVVGITTSYPPGTIDEIEAVVEVITADDEEQELVFLLSEQ